MTLLPEVREELMATAARQAASSRGRPRRGLRGWLPGYARGGDKVSPA
jgi:hypothetical protein